MDCLNGLSLYVLLKEERNGLPVLLNDYPNPVLLKEDSRTGLANLGLGDLLNGKLYRPVGEVCRGE